jgi:hypothetical protein
MLLDTSTDGATWTRLDVGVPGGYQYPGVAYANGRFVLVVFYAFNGGSGPTPLYLTSQDGLNWSPGTWPFPHPGRDGWEVRSVGDRFFATGGWTSLDGLVWTKTGPASPPLAYGAGRWLSASSDGNLQVSTDLVSWTANATGTHRALGAAVYLESLNRFVAVGDSVIVYSSEPPPVEVNWLMEEVAELVSEGTLNGGQGKSLTDKLQKALDALPGDTSSVQRAPDALPGDADRAAALLKVFIHQVRAYRNAGILTAKVADELIAMAEAVIASITR